MFKLLQKYKFWIIFFLLLALVLLVLIYGLLANYRQQQNVIDQDWLVEQVEECSKSGASEQYKCYDKVAKIYLEGKEVRAVLAEIESINQSSVLASNCHDFAHSLGRATLDRYGNVGDAFEQCDFTCHSGCYHGVMERMFNKDSDSGHVTALQIAAKIPTICAAQNFSSPRQSVIFQCLHGVGHAVLYSLNYDLEAALLMCDKFSTSYEQSSCYGGVVMENITAFAKEKRDVNLEDPHYPCNKIAEKYRNACYTMQTSLMAEMGLSVEEMARECDKAPAAYRKQCFVSLGRDLSGRVRFNDGLIVKEACEVYSGSHIFDCVEGVLYALVDYTWDAQHAYPFCEQLSAHNQQQCFTELAYYLRNYYQMSDSEILWQCDKFATKQNQDLCVGSLTQN